MDHMEAYTNRIIEGGYNRLVRFTENVLLRPNDTKNLLGEEKFLALKAVIEKQLENYKHDDLYHYYYSFDRSIHGFCSLERWINWFK